ncbi:MAG: arcadin 1 [Candidatus Nezhaarchaeales archaeon]
MGTAPEVRFKAFVVSKSMFNDPLMGRGLRMELAEERELPPPVMVSQDREVAELARQVMPLVSQVLQALPFTRHGRATVPRLTLWLTEEEWEGLEPKPDVGDEVEVVLRSGRLSIEVRRA